MAKEFLSLSSFRSLDYGKVELAIDRELKRVVQDCMDRPLEKKVRTVQLTLRMVPIPDTSGDGSAVDCDAVAVECEVVSGVPKRRTKVYTMQPHQDGRISFVPEVPEDPDAMLLYDEMSEKDPSNKDGDKRP